MPDAVTGKTVLVTGASRGIGRAFVTELALRGAARVYAAARNPDDCADLVARHGDTVVPVPLDLASAASIDALAMLVPDTDLLVSNAGRSIIKPLLEQDEADIRDMFEVNLFGPLRLVRALLPALRERRGGILYVLSMAALLPALQAEAYSASKAGAAMLAHGIRTATRDSGIQVALVYPGFVDTDLGKAFAVPRATPQQVAARSLDGLARGETSIFPDVFAQMTRDALLQRMPAILAEPNAVLLELVGAFLARPDAGN